MFSRSCQQKAFIWVGVDCVYQINQLHNNEHFCIVWEFFFFFLRDDQNTCRNCLSLSLSQLFEFPVAGSFFAAAVSPSAWVCAVRWCDETLRWTHAVCTGLSLFLVMYVFHVMNDNVSIHYVYFKEENHSFKTNPSSVCSSCLQTAFICEQ